MKKTLLLIAFLLPFLVKAQYFDPISTPQKVHYDVENNIEKTQELYTNTWRKLGKMKVYVVQVCSFTGDKSSTKAQGAAAEVSALLANNGATAKAYVTFQEPTFKVRIGDFPHRLEAYNALLLIQNQYPGAFVTTDHRRLSDIAE